MRTASVASEPSATRTETEPSLPHSFQELPNCCPARSVGFWPPTPETTKAPDFSGAFSSAPSMARTCDLLIRSQVLYPSELWARAPLPRQARALSVAYARNALQGGLGPFGIRIGLQAEGERRKAEGDTHLLPGGLRRFAWRSESGFRRKAESQRYLLPVAFRFPPSACRRFTWKSVAARCASARGSPCSGR